MLTLNLPVRFRDPSRLGGEVESLDPARRRRPAAAIAVTKAIRFDRSVAYVACSYSDAEVLLGLAC